MKSIILVFCLVAAVLEGQVGAKDLPTDQNDVPCKAEALQINQAKSELSNLFLNFIHETEKKSNLIVGFFSTERAEKVKAAFRHCFNYRKDWIMHFAEFLRSLELITTEIESGNTDCKQHLLDFNSANGTAYDQSKVIFERLEDCVKGISNTLKPCTKNGAADQEMIECAWAFENLP